jgi:hypothetical protein
VGAGRVSKIGIVAYFDESGRTSNAGRKAAEGIFLSEIRELISPNRS